jgi:hypothetical protein
MTLGGWQITRSWSARLLVAVLTDVGAAREGLQADGLVRAGHDALCRGVGVESLGELFEYRQEAAPAQDAS